jgi:hypothetical protein
MLRISSGREVVSDPRERAYSVFATGGRELGLRPQTLQR